MRTWVGLHGLHRLFDGDVAAVIDAARVVEAAGVDGVTLTDHVVMSTRTDRYPYGTFPLPLDFPWFEPLTMLAAIAAVTKRARLGTGVLIAPLRPAALLAKIVATLDVVSGGRVDLGVGSGWQREEYQAEGIPFVGRGERLMDTLRACRALWTAAPASFHSPSVSFDDLYSLPAPRQPGGVPIWFGVAANERNCRCIAELGVGWVPMQSKPEEIAPAVERLRAAFAEAGRDPGELRIRAQLPMRFDGKRPSLERTLEGAPAARQAGVTDVEIYPGAFLRNAAELGPFCSAVAELSRAGSR
jgi:probable F420-dependent oxidoreductase